MSNSRSFRRRLRRPREQAQLAAKASARFPARPPALGTVRRWVKKGVADGTIERGPDEHTGKPGRPSHTWQLTAEGKDRAASDPHDAKTMLTELQAKRAHALVKKGVSERRAIAAVTRGWRST